MMLRLSCGVVELFNDVRMGSENQTHQTIVLLWILAHSSMVLLSMVCYCVLGTHVAKHGVLLVAWELMLLSVVCYWVRYWILGHLCS